MLPEGYDHALVNGSEVAPTRYPNLFYGCHNPTPAAVEAANGLPAKGSNLELIDHAEPPPGRANDSAFRGCTEMYLSPFGDAGAALWGPWVYHIGDYPGYDINRLLEGRIPTPGGFRSPIMPAELEVAVPAGVPMANLRRVGEVQTNAWGRPKVTWLLDWGFQ